MFGFRDEFCYLECEACGCLQIANPPDDLSKYYPANYYAFQDNKKDSYVRRYLKRKRGRYALTGRGLIGRLLVQKFGVPVEAVWAKRVGLDYQDAVLDVGCGSGLNLLQMSILGFRNLHGVDPYIERDYRYDNGVVISKRFLSDVTGSYDFIMFHHSFEHMDDPATVLRNVHRILRRDRFALIRIPVAQTHAWNTYGVNWVQLDAPRHTVLYSEQGIKVLADRFGFALEDVVYDSTGFQFWGSEQYVRDIPLFDERSVAINPRNSIFSDAELHQFQTQAVALNGAGDGDQACFYLRKL